MKLTIISKLLRKPKTEILIDLLIKSRLYLMTRQLVDNKELEMLITTTIATLKRNKNKKICGPEEVFKLVKDSLKTDGTRENFSECLRELISNKSVKHNAIYARGC